MVKEHRFSFNKQKDGSDIFLIRIGGKQRSRVKALLCKYMIYKHQEIDRCGKFRRKKGNADQKL